MKKALGLGLLAAVLFFLFVFFKDSMGVSAFYMTAIALGMFAVLGPVGDYFKAGLSILLGVFIGLAGMLVLAGFMPLPPDNVLYVALISSISIFILVLLSAAGLRIDGLFLGWAGYFATVWGTYTTDAAALATGAVPAAVGISVALLLGLLMAMIIMKIAMAVNK